MLDKAIELMASYNVIIRDVLQRGLPLIGSQAVTCDFTDDDGCEYRYFVALDDNGNSRPVHLDTNVGMLREDKL